MVTQVYFIKKSTYYLEINQTVTTNKFQNQSSFNNPKVEIKNSINQI